MTTFLNFLIIVLTIIGIVQVVRIIEIAAKLKGPQDKITLIKIIVTMLLRC